VTAPYDAYVLVHPEPWPASNEPAVVHPVFHDDVPPDEYGQHPVLGDVRDVPRRVEDGQGAVIAEAAAGCGRRVVVDDGTLAEQNDDQDALIAVGLPVSGWDVVPAAPHELDRLAGLLPPGTRVLIAGFSREDCVARAADALRRGGCTVDVHEQVTLPLTDAALALWTGAES
jgi:hypothetical protein